MSCLASFHYFMRGSHSIHIVYVAKPHYLFLLIRRATDERLVSIHETQIRNKTQKSPCSVQTTFVYMHVRPSRPVGGGRGGAFNINLTKTKAKTYTSSHAAMDRLGRACPCHWAGPKDKPLCYRVLQQHSYNAHRSAL